MNLTEQKPDLFIEKVSGNIEAEYYVKIGSSEYAPAIASVFENRFADVTAEDALYNASLFAAVPQLGSIAEAAQILINNLVPDDEGGYSIEDYYIINIQKALTEFADKLLSVTKQS